MDLLSKIKCSNVLIHSHLYWFTELNVEGGELFYHLRSSKTFCEERVKFYAACVLLALQHMQSKNIAYRDLKLENIMLDDAGYPILTDFGLAMQQQ